MLSLKKYNPLFLSLLCYMLLWYLLYPWLKFMLDSDAVSYLTIAKRVATGDYFTSINGLWSPLNSWLLVPFIQNGYDAWSIALQLNFLFGGIIIIQVFFLFHKFFLSNAAINILLCILPVVLVFMVYYQVFGDVLQLIFVLLYLSVLWFKKERSVSYLQAILCGLLMGLAFYAKAYSFLFFGFHFFVQLAWLAWSRRMIFKKAITLYITGILVALLTILPWTFALHKKYGGWLMGHAGKLNMSWYINSGKSFRPDIKLLIPPAYGDSPAFWEDPFLSQQDLSTPLSSGRHFVKWIIRVLHTTIICTFCFQEISGFSLAILCISLFYFFYIKKKEAYTDNNTPVRLLLLTIVCLPAGYLLMHIETRYIWLDVFLLMISGIILIDLFFQQYQQPVAIRNLCYILFALSFALFPVYQFENLKYKNRDLFETADYLRQHNFKGSFTSNATDAGRMWVVAFLTGSNFYTIERTDYSYTELLDEMQRYNVRYLLLENTGYSFDEGLKEMKLLAQYKNMALFERIRYVP